MAGRHRGRVCIPLPAAMLHESAMSWEIPQGEKSRNGQHYPRPLFSLFLHAHQSGEEIRGPYKDPILRDPPRALSAALPHRLNI